MADSLVKLSESIFEVFILCFQSYLCSFCTISSGLRVQFRYLLANLKASLHCQIFCDHSGKFSLINSMFSSTCTKLLRKVN